MKGRRIFSMMAALVFAALFSACEKNEKETPVQGEDAIVAILNNTALVSLNGSSVTKETLEYCMAAGIEIYSPTNN